MLHSGNVFQSRYIIMRSHWIRVVEGISLPGKHDCSWRDKPIIIKWYTWFLKLHSACVLRIALQRGRYWDASSTTNKTCLIIGLCIKDKSVGEPQWGTCTMPIICSVVLYTSVAKWCPAGCTDKYRKACAVCCVHYDDQASFFTAVEWDLASTSISHAFTQGKPLLKEISNYKTKERFL